MRVKHSHIVAAPLLELPIAHCASNLLLDRLLKLIKWTSGRFQDFMQHSDSLQTCRFSPSGTLLFTVAHNEILLWEVQGF